MLHLRALFLCIKYNDAVGFGQHIFFYAKCVLNLKNKHEIAKIMPKNPKDVV